VYWLFGSKTIIKDAQQALAIFMLFILLSGLLSSILGGILSDKIGRKPVIIVSCILFAIGLVCLGLFTFSYMLLLLCAVISGTAVGAFMAADLGLANEVIDQSASAKELGTFQVSQNLPLIFSAPLSGIIRKYYQ
jgi:MFS family permease